MRRIVVAIVALGLVLPAAAAPAEVRGVDELSLEREAADGTVGLYTTSLSRAEVRRALEEADSSPSVVLELPPADGEPGGRYPVTARGDGLTGVLTLKNPIQKKWVKHPF